MKFLLSFLLICLFLEVRADTVSTDKWYDYFSPALELYDFTHDSINNELRLDLKLSLSSINTDRNNYLLYLEYEYDKDVDPFDGSQVLNWSWDLEQRYEYKNAYLKNISYINFIKTEISKENSVYSRHYDMTLGPVGAKYHFYSDKTVQELSLSFIPLYNIIAYDVWESDLVSGDLALKKYLTRSLEYTFKLRMTLLLFSGKVTLDDEISYKKIHFLSGSFLDDTLDEDDTLNDEFKNIVTINYNFTEYFQIGFSNEINTDVIRKRQGEPLTERINKINFTLRWN